MNRQLSSKAAAAKLRFDEAEQFLEKALAATEVGHRADKLTVSVAVGEALHRLKEATAIREALHVVDFVKKPR